MAAPASTLAAVVLICCFGWAGVAKLVRFGNWRAALDGYGIPTTIAPTVLAGVPLAEIAVVVLLLIGPVKSGAALALALVAAFSWAILRAHGLRGDRLPCGCFGSTQERDYRVMLTRNAVLGAVAAVILLSPAETAVVEDLAGLSTGDILPVTLSGLAVLTLLWMVRQVTNALRGRQS
jgi:hypothetical protein